MGFFDTPTQQETIQSYTNDTLGKYTQAYRDAAPWGFASLDPNATLAAMGSGTDLSGKELGADFKASLKKMSDQEKEQAQISQDALKRINQRQTSGQFLTPQETEFVNTSLDKAFESSRSIAIKDWELGAQKLAGSRGMRTSDTPVAQPAMNALRDMELGFSSQRASAGLDATMKLSANQNMFDQSLSDSLQSLQFNRWNARQGHLFGGGASAAANINYTAKSNTKGKQGMSGFGQVMAGFQMANATLDLGSRLAQGSKTPPIKSGMT